jgi:ornithine lipid hydroxylase
MLSRSLRDLARWSVFPALVAGTAAIAIWGSGVDLAAGIGLAAVPSEAILYPAVIALGWTSIALLERWLPYRREWRRSHGDVGTDVAHLLVSATFASGVARAVLGMTAVVAAGWLSTRMGLVLWPSSWPWAIQLALALAVAELGHYAFHRLSHEHPLVWRLHAAHHSAPRLYWLNATRFHPGDLVSLIVFQTAPLILLGINARAMFLYAVFTAVYGQLQHCNVDLRTGALSWVFSTPEIHRWHHSTNPREGNSNYGAVLNLWDLLFGTLHFPRDRRFHGPVGIGDMPAFPQGYVAQLLSPLRWSHLPRSAELSPDAGDR